VFAHRGSTGRATENTVAAFAEARLLGADGVELDVHLSADGALVVHHDAEIPGVGPIAALEVHRLPPEVPLLAEALEACHGMVVNVELKRPPVPRAAGPGLGAAAAAALDELGWTEGVVVSSFDPGLLADVRSADPRLALGLLLEWTADPLAGLARAVEAGYQALHPFVATVGAPLVEAARAAGLALNVWTVNSAEDLAAMADLGVDAVITDQVAEALAAVRPG
jgi:glycerophosphoryl diester phosphodiesterase